MAELKSTGYLESLVDQALNNLDLRLIIHVVGITYSGDAELRITCEDADHHEIAGANVSIPLGGSLTLEGMTIQFREPKTVFLIGHRR